MPIVYMEEPDVVGVSHLHLVLSHPGQVINDYNFCQLFSKAWIHAMTTTNDYNQYVIVISPLRVLYPDLQTRLTRAAKHPSGSVCKWILHDKGCYN